MDTKLINVILFLVPFLTSCSSVVGVAKKDSSSPPQGKSILAAVDREYGASAKKKSPLAAELCSFSPANHKASEPASRKWSVNRRSEQKANRRNPTIPDLKFPVPSGRLSSGFGLRKGIFHAGLDISACKGDPIVACADGIVVATGSRKGYRSYGQTVLVDHGQNVFTHYAHASRVLVRAGQKVRKGDKIALIGATGRATSPHLHLEIRVGNQLLNPYAHFSPVQLKGIQVAKDFLGRPMGPVQSRSGLFNLSSFFK